MYFTYMDVNNKAWKELAVPYDVKTEWILDNLIRAARFRTSFGNDGGTIANMLQKIHYKIYLSAKSKIPDDDPFWIEFWEPAVYIGKFHYSLEKQNEILAKLSLISSHKSQIKNFNNYNRYFFTKRILNNMIYSIEYKNNLEEADAYFKAVETMLPIIDDFTKSTFDFYAPRYDVSMVQQIPEDFVSSVLVAYMYSIKLDNKKACNNFLKEEILFKLTSFIHDKNKISFFVRDAKKLEALKNDLNGMIIFFNKHYKEQCTNN